MLKRMARNFTTTARSFKGETFKFQDSLPSLPVPTIEQTKKRYLKSIRPYVANEEQYAKHEQLVEDFFATQGPQLQERLQELQSKSRNWLSENYWDDYAYLQYRDPIVPFVSYFFGHKNLPLGQQEIGKNQLYKAVAVIDKVTTFAELLKNESLPADQVKGGAFCMESFKWMFNTARYPQAPGQDSNVFHDTRASENQFVIVAVNNYYFKLYTHDPTTGERYPNNIIFQQLLKIQQLGYSRPKNDKSIGVLTALPRDDYYEVYQELKASQVNRESLDTLARSTFFIALDEDLPVTYEDRAHYAWHGNGQNRFFDKAVEFFVARNGYLGFLGEHSRMDGSPTLVLNEFVARELTKLNPEEFLSSLNTNFGQQLPVEPTILNFEITPGVDAAIESAKAGLQAQIDNHQVKVLHYQRFAKKAIKTFKTSPDALVQSIIQLGFYKQNKHLWPTYEASATRKFFRGRTEVTRSVSEEALKFVQNWENPTVSSAQRHEDLRNTINQHVDYTKAAINGLGVDRHFLGLKLQLKEGEEPHPLFRDEIFNYSQTWLISTSQLSSNFLDAWGFSEVHPIGYGIGYSITDDYLHFNICTRRSSGNDAEDLAHYISEAADEVFEVLSKHTDKPKL